MLPYSALGDAFNPEMIDTDGFTTKSLTHKKVICINSKHGTLQRRRFTLAHELGHVVLNHPLKPPVYRNSESDHNQKPEEVQEMCIRDRLCEYIFCRLCDADIYRPETPISCQVS